MYGSCNRMNADYMTITINPGGTKQIVSIMAAIDILDKLQPDQPPITRSKRHRTPEERREQKRRYQKNYMRRKRAQQERDRAIVWQEKIQNEPEIP
jgi:hypothetical protein